jgi:putative nucleotidyltransferase with HDIG domain
MPTEAPPRRPTTSFWKKRRGPREEGAAPIRAVSPFFWAVAYVLATTFSYSPSFSFRSSPPAAVGTIAQRDVVAPRDLIVPDSVATERRRAEAVAEVLPVYDWDSGAGARAERKLRQSFQTAREGWAVTRRHPGSGPVPQSVRDAFELPIRDEAMAALARLGFSRAIEDRVVSAAVEQYRGGVVDNRDLLMEIGGKGVLMHDTASSREVRRKELTDVVEYGSQARTALAAKLSGAPLTGREASEVGGFLATVLRPNLTHNGQETLRRREQAARSVETVLTKIPRGKVIVRKGDEVSPRAAEWIQAARASVSDPSSWVKLSGVVILQVLAAAVFWVDARRKRRRRRERTPTAVYASVLATGIVFALVTRGAFALAESLSSSFEGSAWASHTYYAIPFAAGAIMTSLVAGMGPALLFSAVHAVGAGILMGMNFNFTLFALIGSLAGLFGLRKLGSRSVLLGMGGILAAANLVSITSLGLLAGERGGWDFFGDLLGGFAGGWFVAMLIGLLLPVFEHVFHVTTDIRLLELSNQNLPLLRTLALEAPGTYQHSLMLGHLAEAAAEAIGADSLLARVGGYYHDIGKTKMPDYFIENQPKGYNRHDRLEPSMSALVIAMHVKEGSEMAKKARLPAPIVDAIREHHGTKLIRYFYQKALTKAPPQGAVQELEYRHSGPKPSTRVNGILMICDAVEAASRTLIEPTPAKIRAMIQTIVDDCLRDGQFDECDLTMRDLAVIVDTLERTVTTMYHHRIDYPGFDFNREKPRRRTSETVPIEPAAPAARTGPARLR